MFREIINNLSTAFGGIRGDNIEKEKYEKRARYKRRVLNHLTNTEINKLAKEFISSKPKVRMINDKGIEEFREPTRQELIDALFDRAPLDEIHRLLPRSKSIN